MFVFWIFFFPIDPAPPTADLKALVSQLGDNAYTVREKAHRELAKRGYKALTALEEATKNDDAEIRNRASALLDDFYSLPELPAIYGLPKMVILPRGRIIAFPPGLSKILYWKALGRQDWEWNEAAFSAATRELCEFLLRRGLSKEDVLVVIAAIREHRDEHQYGDMDEPVSSLPLLLLYGKMNTVRSYLK